MKRGLFACLLAVSLATPAFASDPALDAYYTATIAETTKLEAERLKKEIDSYPDRIRTYRRENGIRDVRRAAPIHKQWFAEQKQRLAETKKELIAIRRGKKIVPTLSVADLRIGQIGRLPLDDDGNGVSVFIKIRGTLDIEGEKVLDCELQRVRDYERDGTEYRIPEGRPFGRFLISGVSIDLDALQRRTDASRLGSVFRPTDLVFHVSDTHVEGKWRIFVLDVYSPSSD